VNARFLILFFLIVALFSSCVKTKTKYKTAAANANSEIRYAKGFTIQRFASYTQIVVRSPWDKTKVLETYILVDRNRPLPSNLPLGTVVKVPIKKVALCSAVHAGMWNLLGHADQINAVCEPEYMRFSIIQKGLADGKIINLGMHTSINTEKLMSAAPDILVVSPFENSADDRFKNVGIVVVKDASYMESSPLGRSEWIKFEAAFAGERVKADQIFGDIEKRYLELCKKVEGTKVRPTVFTEKKYGDAWYVSGGNSYIGQFLKDAGANYLWGDLDNTGSIPLSFEAVYAKAVNAQFWLIKYNNPQTDLTYNELKAEYELYGNFKAFKNKNIFGVNSAKSPFYEQGAMEPDLVLADLVSIFHPEIMMEYKPTYYFKIN
jgi:iron complex transport system substrate-binding protein